MSNALTNTSWSPYVVGAGIGVLSWLAFWTADHPLGSPPLLSTDGQMTDAGSAGEHSSHSNRY